MVPGSSITRISRSNSRNYVKNKPDGNWKWFYADGKLLRDENYKDGKEDGKSAEYDEQGIVIAEGMMTGGTREGQWKYKNGQYIAEGTFVEGNQDGVWKQYYENGKLAFEGEYFDGRKTGSMDTCNVVRKSGIGLGLEGDWKVG